MSDLSAAMEVRVAAKTAECEGIFGFELVSLNGAPLPGFSAGSHIDVQIPGGLTRQYSLCGDPTETHRYQIAVLRDPKTRGGSAAMHDEVQPGDVVRISAPKNHFALAHGARHNLLLAGGIGVTPILCMAERLATTGGSFEMHYCTRSRDRTAFLGRIEGSPYSDRVHFHFDDGAVEQRLDMAACLATPAVGVHLYVCGPKGFMDAVLATARANGWPESQLHYEFFAGEVLGSASDAGFEVQIASSGRVVAVSREQTVIQALAAAGIEIPFACEQGVCGTCLTRVLEGVPDHKDMYLSPDEQLANDQFLPCCSRAKSSRLVLDL
jgi:vanillate O-demethylase ferredoxin subunit